MTPLSTVENIANAVLYEGYMLYPYRASSVKNRQRFNWGCLMPPTFCSANPGSDRSTMRTEILFRAAGEAEVEVKIRFLQLVERTIHEILSDGGARRVESLDVDGEMYVPWQEAIERSIEFGEVRGGRETYRKDFELPGEHREECVTDSQGRSRAKIVRESSTLKCEVTASVEPLFAEIFKLSVSVANTAAGDDAGRDAALLRSLVSTHTILLASGCEFISQLDPPAELVQLSQQCESDGTYPVLAGENGAADCVLSSPIILYDHPEVAAESPGDLFDGLEIDEILTLRIMTLTDAEKREMRAVDERARMILERTENMPDEQFAKMHGAIRGLKKKESAYG